MGIKENENIVGFRFRPVGKFSEKVEL